MNAAPPVASPASTWRKMALLFIMYMLQNICLGFTWTILPVTMRKLGVSLGAIGLTALIYCPWALKFLWASYVDRYYSPRRGRRKSWITPLCWITLGLVMALSALDPQDNMVTALAMVFLLNMVIATTDIAVDGYATDMLAPAERSWGNATQMAGYTTGYMLGAGVFLMIYQSLGWEFTLLIMAAAYLVLMAPVLLHRELPPTGEAAAVAASGNHKPSARHFLSLAGTRWFILFLIMVGIMEKGGSQMRLALVSDLGLDARDLGIILLWAGGPLSILGAVLGGALLNRWGSSRVFILGCLAAACLSWFTALAAAGTCNSGWEAGIMLCAERMSSGIIMVLVYSLIMHLSAGPQSATNFAVLCSLFHAVMLASATLAGFLGDLSGYAVFYAGLGIFGILTLLAGQSILNKRLQLPEDATRRRP